MSSSALSGRGLAWSVGAHYVLLDLDIELSAGEWVALRGDNGAGKTTLLHILSGRLPAAAGQVQLHGTALGELDPGYVGGQLGWLGHKPGLYLELSARENLALFAAVAGRALASAEVDQLLSDVGLATTDRDRPVRGFSRGMQQRAGLARVAASGAKVWLLDEPTTGLDVSGRATLQQRLRAAAKDGIAILSATHDEDLTAAADRVVELRAGQLHEVRA